MIYLTERITTSPGLLNGKPSIRGMRISVQTVLGHLEAGDTREDILESFPCLEKEDLDACLAFDKTLLKTLSEKPTIETNPTAAHSQLLKQKVYVF